MQLIGRHSLLLLGRRRPPKVIEADAEPPVDAVVHLKVLVADLLRRQILGERLRLGGRAVLVGAANVQGVVAGHARVPGEDVARQHAADDVAEMRHIVDVRQRRGDQHVLAARNWETEREGEGLNYLVLD